jgi:16S rRNA (adenine1518-N6/adenine1519-N6)-dimethyltransferase
LNNVPELNPANLIKQYGLHAAKRLGQNFLQSKNDLEFIAAAAVIVKTDSVLEIGPGLGSLTRYLSFYAQEVVAVELDEKLDKILKVVLKPYNNIRVVYGDILKLSPSELGLPPKYILAANIPYNITSAIIRHLLESEIKPRRLVLTIQKDVAERICETPPEMSLLALSVQVYGKPAILKFIPAEAFFPAPQVESAVLKIEVSPEPLIPSTDLPIFFKLTRAGFSQKRKTLRNALSAGLGITTLEAEVLLNQAGVDPKRRAETLSLEEWGFLTRSRKNRYS